MSGEVSGQLLSGFVRGAVERYSQGYPSLGLYSTTPRGLSIKSDFLSCLLGGHVPLNGKLMDSSADRAGPEVWPWEMTEWEWSISTPTRTGIRDLVTTPRMTASECSFLPFSLHQ